MRLSGFVHGSVRPQTPALGVQRVINLMPVPEPSKTSVAKSAYLAVPGYVAAYTGLDGPVRGMLTNNGRTFAVAGATLVELFSDGTFTSYGAVIDDGRTAHLATNGDGGLQLAVASGGVLSILDLVTNVLTVVADVDAPTDVSWLLFLDSYFIVGRVDTGIIQISAFEDGTDWDGTDVAQRSTAPDRIVRGVLVGETLWTLGSETIEFLYDAGTTFPLQPINESTVRGYGCAAADSVATLDGLPIWLGLSGDAGVAVYHGRGVGAAPARVSTDGLEALWAALDDVSDADGWTYTEAGRTCYVLTVGGQTYVYDASTQLWHERGTWQTDTGTYDPDLGRCHTVAFGSHLVGSRVDGTIYRMAPDVYALAGEPLRWSLTTGTILDEQRWLFHARVQLRMQTGVGLPTGQGVNPLVFAEISDDGGRTFSDPIPASLGPQGEYDTSVEWRMLGRSRLGRVYRFTGSDPVSTSIADGYAEIARGAA